MNKRKLIICVKKQRSSYNNFISGHNSTVVRVALDENECTDEIKEWLTFDRECHMREKLAAESLSSYEVDVSSEDQSIYSSHMSTDDDPEIDTFESMNENKRQNSKQNTNEFRGAAQIFRRKFLNLDMTACWLNSSLQLLLNAMDHSESKELWNSELGEELLQLQKNQNFPLDATLVK